MARPLKEGMDYFPHDTDATGDEKVEALRALYGNDGYAFYFISLERIYRTSSCELDVSDAETKQILANKIGVPLELLEKMLVTAFKVGAFDRQTYEERGVLTSNGIKKRAALVLEKRERMRARYHQSVPGVFAAKTTEETMAETPQSKVKKRKACITPHVPPTGVDGVSDNTAVKPTTAENGGEGGAHPTTGGRGSKTPAAEKPSRPGARQKGGRGEVVPLVPDGFETFWQMYPRRVERLRAIRAWNARIREGTDPETLIKAARNYGQKVTDTDERYIKHAATFLGRDKPFQEYVGGENNATSGNGDKPTDTDKYADWGTLHNPN